MKGNDQVIEKLNQLLAEELTAINQYMVHTEMTENWGYEKLSKEDEKRAFTEMKHAERLIERILFLDGIPIVSQLNKIAIGRDVEVQHKNDLALEMGALKSYNDAIAVAASAGDNGTREMLDSILKDEEQHVDQLESELEQIMQMGIQNYLSEQV